MEIKYTDFNYVISMTNGILGISILAMPYCFDQCGLILGTFALIFSAFMTSYSCKLLMKTADLKNSKNLEVLAFKIFGSSGKFLIEICIILLLFGSLVTYQQTINDSAPKFFATLLNIEHSKIPHNLLMFFFTIFVLLPLSLSKRLEKFNKLSTFAIFFYFLFGFNFLLSCYFKYQNEISLKNLNYWNFDGLLKCFPIFCGSFSCQTIIFVVHEELPDLIKKDFNKLLDLSLFVAFVAYFMTGVFGSIAYNDSIILGNAMVMIPQSLMSQLLLLGFIFCVMSGFPYMIFPCRSSLNTLLFSSQKSNDFMDSDVIISEKRFNFITYFLLFFISITAMLIPNMEFVLSLNGATTGTLICYVWPSLMFLCSLSKSEKKEQKLVKVFLWIGFAIFCFSTLITLNKFQPTKENADLLQKNEHLIKKTTESNDFQTFKSLYIQNLLNEKRLEPPNPGIEIQERGNFHKTESISKKTNNNLIKDYNSTLVRSKRFADKSNQIFNSMIPQNSTI